MPICNKCNKCFPNKIKIENKIRNLYNRKYCIDCLPFLSNISLAEKEYMNSPTLCLTCNKQLSFNRRKEKFCSRSCSVTYNNKKKRKKFCLNCENYVGINSKKSKKYCSIKCQNDYKYKRYIENWKLGEESGIRGSYQISNYIRQYLFERYNNACSKCGWSEINTCTNRIPLEVEHIDGNYQNNSEGNLTLLCPNCPSLTSTYKSLNKGNGRKERRKYDLNYN